MRDITNQLIDLVVVQQYRGFSCLIPISVYRTLPSFVNALLSFRKELLKAVRCVLQSLLVAPEKSFIFCLHRNSNLLRLKQYWHCMSYNFVIIVLYCTNRNHSIGCRISTTNRKLNSIAKILQPAFLVRLGGGMGLYHSLGLLSSYIQNDKNEGWKHYFYRLPFHLKEIYK